MLCQVIMQHGLVFHPDQCEDWAAFLLGWLWGPRAEAPGRPAQPFAYPQSVTRLVHDETAPPPPPGGWASVLTRRRLKSTFGQIEEAIARLAEMGDDGLELQDRYLTKVHVRRLANVTE